MEEKTKAELAKLQADSAAPSSFAQINAEGDVPFMGLANWLDGDQDPLTKVAKPSSFVEEGTPDSFADIDAKLKALEEKTKAELAKLQSDTAAPSSFLQSRGDDDEDISKSEERAEQAAEEVQEIAHKLDSQQKRMKTAEDEL